MNKMAGYKLSFLLDIGVPILIYNGDKDYICNWMGGLAWTEALEWSGQPEFNSNQLEEWVTQSGLEAGQSKQSGSLTYLRVYDAGHMVPMDQPQAAFEMLVEFMKTKTVNQLNNAK